MGSTRSHPGSLRPKLLAYFAGPSRVTSIDTSGGPNRPLRLTYRRMRTGYASSEITRTSIAAHRCLVLGRNNHFGSKSKRGTEVAAMFYSLIESAVTVR